MKKIIGLFIEEYLIRMGLEKALEEEYKIVLIDNNGDLEGKSLDLLIFNKKISENNLKKMYFSANNTYLIDQSISQISSTIKKDELLEAVEKSLEGQIYEEKKIREEKKKDQKILEEYKGLNNRQKKLIKSLLAEKTNKEIAREFYLSEKTIKNALTEVYLKMNISGRKELQKNCKNLLTLDLIDVII
ncbi:LuxR C-terminal-related transcriptional regulator [uncultured Peptoniphilus sp.]|uniref:LuxR C-terminal-related transcriptional regulator n=1 Tax=uncultured Peptoniphilus sp. TaxID=254354 RepID=UPI0028056A59|nr:LuxR C-terminal-related transcriptional regulator [uncultured Peptoniphilus sp.]